MRHFDPDIARHVLRQLASGHYYTFRSAEEIQQLEQFQKCGLLQASHPYKGMQQTMAQGVSVTDMTDKCLRYAQAALDDDRWPEVEGELKNLPC